MTEILSLIVGFLIWPGLIVAAALGFFYMWLMRKLTARMQGRKGPPFYQPFFDFVKLVGKRSLVPRDSSRVLFFLLPFISLTSTVFGLMILPLPGSAAPSFSGDLVLLLYLMEMPVLCDVLAGFVSRSIYGQVSAMREAVMSLAYSVPLLASVIALAQAADTFRLAELHTAPFGLVTVIAFIAFAMAIPARLKSNPFSIPNAEHEIGHGAHMEYNGLPLAVFELSHALELMLLIGTLYVLFLPGTGHVATDALVYLAAGFAVVALVVFAKVSTARFTVKSALRFYWLWGGLAAGAAMVVAIVS
ncbi:complex I subunit 1 family protein [Breoghania sp. JC706]|uniref:respiratory chain complex I subunit 1 family protein n=1 Tax=Breoghania sp. JC706 TaxID=3117732 RepID=UPI0030092040